MVPENTDRFDRRSPAYRCDIDKCLRMVPAICARRPVVQGVTVDGPTSRDLDDMFHITRDGVGYSLEVSIANPGAVLAPDSLLSRDAEQRVATRYFARGNDPMLARELSEGGLSLLPGELRPARTVRFPLSSRLVMGTPEIFLSAARSVQQYHYVGATQAISDVKDPHYEQFVLLSRLAGMLLRTRREAGAIAFCNPAKGALLDEDGRLVRVAPGEFHAHIIVQEMMILANRALSQFALDHDIPVLFRNHEARAATDRDALLAQIASVFALDTTDSIVQTTAMLAGHLGRAEHGSSCKGHFALNVPGYMHGSSPLRRLQDLVSDRNVTAYLEGRAFPHPREQLDGVAERINAWERDRREARSEGFAERVRARAVQELPERLPHVPSHVFSQAVKFAITEEEPTRVAAAILSRQQQGKLPLKDLYRLLVLAPRTSAWQELRERCAALAVEGGPSVGVQLLTMHEQQQSAQTVRIQIKPEARAGGEGFLATVSVWEEGRSVASHEEWDISGVVAKQSAAVGCLYRLCELPPREPRKAVGVEGASASALAPTSWKNQLLELAQARRIALPVFASERAGGSSHAPLFRSSVETNLAGQGFVGQGTGRTIKEAEQAAAEHLVHQLTPVLEAASIAAKPQRIPLAPASENAKGILYELCAQRKWPTPRFRGGQTATPQGILFSCQAVVRIGEETLISQSMHAPQKRLAEQQAAADLLTRLRERETLGEERKGEAGN